MDFSRRQLIALGGGIAAAASLAACGTNTGRSPDASATGAKVALTQWFHEYGEKGVQDALKRYFAAYSAATATVTWKPGEFEKAVAAALLTSNVPDAFEYANGPTLDMIKAGQVVDVTDVLGDAKAEYEQRVIKRLTYKDKIWAIPQTIDMQLLYYRKSLLQKANVQPPTTFDALIDAAKKVKTNDVGGFYAGKDGGLGVLGNILIWASGNTQLNEAKTEAGFNSDTFFEAATKYAEFYKSGAVLASASADWYDGAAFVNGETAMQWGGLWSLPDIKKAHGDDFGVLPFPTIGATGKPVVPFGAFSACVAAKGPQVDATKAFVKWLWVDQEDDQVDFANSYGTHIPAKTKLVAKADKLASGAGAEAAKYVAENGETADIMWTDPIGQAFSAALENVVKKGANAKSEFAPVVTKVAAELKRVNG